MPYFANRRQFCTICTYLGHLLSVKIDQKLEENLFKVYILFRVKNAFGCFIEGKIFYIQVTRFEGKFSYLAIWKKVVQFCEPLVVCFVVFLRIPFFQAAKNKQKGTH